MSDAAAEKAPSKFARAEAGARGVVIIVGAGVMAFFVGGMLTTGLSVRLAERVGDVTQPQLAFAVGWLLQRAWLFVVLPVIAWVVARFLSLDGSKFSWGAAISGEVFGVALALAVNGEDFLIFDWVDGVAQAVTFVLGVVLVRRAFAAGLEANEEAQREADAFAQKQKAEYAEFLARAEGKPEPSPAPAPVTPPQEPPPPASST